jgi:hypothetical protein
LGFGKEVTMTRQACVGTVVALMMALTGVGHSTLSAQIPSLSGAQATAAKASPELVGALSKQLGSSPEQAAGAAGALFGIAKSQLKANDFSKVAAAVPGMAALLSAAPPTGGGGGAANALSQLAGQAGTLAAAAGAFNKLGLKPELVAQAIPVLTSFVTKSGGAGVGNLLAGVLK